MELVQIYFYNLEKLQLLPISLHFLYLQFFYLDLENECGSMRILIHSPAFQP